VDELNPRTPKALDVCFKQRVQGCVNKVMARLRAISKYARHPTRQRQLQRVVEGDQIIEQAIAGFEARMWRAG